MNFREIWHGPSFLNRSESARRMTVRDDIGKRVKKTKKKHYEEHFSKNWDVDLWD